MIIGCIKELKKHEYRVGLTPSNVSEYVCRGHQVLIEKDAGLGSSFDNDEYSKAGAEILDTAKAVWSRAEMIIKVKEPLEQEYQFLRENQILYTYLHLAADWALTEALIKSKTIGIAYETITDKNGTLPLLTPMSEVAGRLSIQEGAKYLEKPFGGRGVLLSGVPGTKCGKVVILGGGVVGLNACKMAVGLGADVTIIDVNLDRLRYLDDIFGARIKTSYSTQSNITGEIKDADLVIGAVLIPGAKAPKLLCREHLSMMQNGSVIVDVAVDQGGCFETTKATYHDNPTFVIDGVVHYCVANMPGATPRTSTTALTNATLSIGLLIADKGVEDACRVNPYIIPGINTYRGGLVHEKVAEAFDMECVKLDIR